MRLPAIIYEVNLMFLLAGNVHLNRETFYAPT